MKRIGLKIFKWISYIVLGIVGLFLIIWITLQFPQVQTYVVGKVTSGLSEKLQVPVRIKKVNLNFFKTLVLEGIYIEDKQKDTLLYAGELRASIGILSLANQTFELSSVGLDDAYVNIYQRKQDSVVNYDFILKAFASDTTKKDTTTSAWKFDMAGVDLNNVRVKYYDFPSHTDVKVAVHSLDVDINTLGLTERNTKINDVSIAGLQLSYHQILGNALKDTIEKKIVTNPPPAWLLGLEEVRIENSGIVFENENAKHVSEGIDFNHLGLSDFNLDVSDIIVAGSDFSGNIEKLSLKERKGFVLDNLALSAFLKNSQLHAELNEFRSPHSNLKDKITVDIKDITKIADEIDAIAANANFDESVISMKDIVHFAPNLTSYKNLNLSLSGDLKGHVGNLQFNNADLALNEENYIKGDFFIKGLPDINKLVFDVTSKVRVQGNYITQLMPPKTLPIELKSLGDINISLSANGDIHHFKSKSSLQTAAGRAAYDLKIKLNKQLLPATLSGTISTDRLHLGKILDNPQLGILSMNTKLDSKGTNNTSLQSSITKVEFNKYAYSDIEIDGGYVNNVADVNISIDDSNLVTDLKAYVNMAQKPFTYHLIGNTNANLHRLNFYATPMRVSTNLDLEAEGQNIDSINAKLLISNFSLVNDSLEYTLDTLKGSMSYENGNKKIDIKSDLVDANIGGHFTYSEVPAAIQHLMSHYMAAFKPKSKPVHIDSMRFDIALKETKNITRIFVPGLTDVKDIRLKGSFHESTHLLDVDGKIGLINFQDKNIKNLLLDVRGDKEKLDIALKLNTLHVNQNVKLYNPTFKGIFSKDVLRFNLGMADTTSTSRLDMDGILGLKGDSVDFQLPKLFMSVRGKEWKLSEKARIQYATKYLRISGLNFSSGNQLISIATKNETSKNPILNALFKEVSLGDLTKIMRMPYDLAGELNGSAEITNPMGAMSISSRLTIDSLMADKRNIGNLKFTGNKNTQGPLNINTTLTGGTNDVHIAGNYYLDKIEDNLNFKIDINNLNTSTIQPFVKDILYTLKGNLQAHLMFTGSPAAPLLTGKMFFKETHVVGVTAIQTQYKIVNQEISFNPNSVQFNNFVFLDTANNAANVNGFIYHKKMQDFNLALNFKATDFHFLDSKNSVAPISGKFIADVTAKAEGPMEDLKIRLKLLTKPGTDLALNLATKKTLSGTPEYIKFINFTDDSSGFQKVLLDSMVVDNHSKIDFSRFKINGNITVTKEAQFRIIINPNTGDQITAKGDGSFRMNFDSNNDVNLFGQYIIDDGSYSLNLMSVMKRNFKIDKGSIINFYGNPQQGEMDIAAIYTTKASRYELINDQEEMMTKEQISASKRRLPVSLYLKLKGEFLKPQITFDIKVAESNSSVSIVEERLNQIRADETELNKQVFGLLVMNKFLPYQGGKVDNGGGGGINESATATVGSLIADQLNKISDEYLNGIELEVNTETESVDDQVRSNVSVMANKKISDRLTVGIGGKTNVSNQGNTSGMTGESNVLYQVNKQGTVNMKLFTTGQQNIYTGSNNQISGFSINHSKNFNSFKDFFKR